MMRSAICLFAIPLFLSLGIAKATAQQLVAAGSAAEHEAAVLFSEDFSVPSDRWDIYPGDARYFNGAILVRDNIGGGSIFVPYDRTFSDQSIRVETTLVGGTDDNWQTVACRFSPGANYYDLGISADGYYMLDVWVNGRRLSKSIGPTRSPHIRLGRNAVNVLQVDCVGDLLTLTVNGKVLAQLRDDHHTSGNIALSVNALAGRFSEVAFDNLLVYQR